MAQAPSYPHAVDSAGIVRLGVPCRLCGYSLRALHEQSKCPECGAPVELSLDRSLLRFAPVSWVRALWVGAGMNLAGWSLPIALALLGALDAANVIPGTLQRLTGAVLSLAAIGLVFCGSWLITTYEPGAEWYTEIANAQRRSTRKAIRTSAIGLGVFICMMVVGWDDSFTVLIGVIGMLVAIVAAVTWHIRMIAPVASAVRRAPDLRLADSAERISIYFIVFVCLIAAMLGMGVLHGGLALLVLPLALLAGVVAWITYLIFLLQAMNRFKGEYQAALRTQEPS